MAEDVNDKIGQLVRKLAPGELEALLALIKKSTAEGREASELGARRHT